MSKKIFDEVCALVKRGWPMLPCTGKRKFPCVPWREFQHRLPTDEEIRVWDPKFMPTAWGVVTGKMSGLVVVDFDGENGRKWLGEWGLDPHVRTGSGGYHFYVLHPGWAVSTLNAKSKESWPFPGVDIRGDGGFAIVHGYSGYGPYAQLRELIPDRFDVLPPEVRDFLRNHLPKKAAVVKNSPRAPTTVGLRGNQVDTGGLIDQAIELNRGRNNDGFWLACQLRDNGYSISDAASEMRLYRSRVPSTNAKGVLEPYTENEMIASLNEAYSSPAREPWGWRGPSTSTSPSAQGSRRRTLAAANPEGDPSPDPFKYARIPQRVLIDRNLKPRDVCVYGALAGSVWQGNVASMGKRAIAQFAHCAERLVTDSLKNLVRTGHLRKYPVQHGQRGVYELLSSVFGQKQRAGYEEMVMDPSGNRRLVSVRPQRSASRTRR